MTAGLRTTCGSRMLENFVAPYDAHVVERLKSAGSVLVGKTNMDEFAMGSSTENSWFGPVRNPWKLDAVPGGSSGGSAAAVAAGLVPGSTGTDTGGSIRQPASFTGITGFKPTYGTCSRYGLVAFASSLDTPGVFARTAHDCALLLNAMAGHDARDSTSLERATEDYTRELRIAPADAAKPLAGLRVGLPAQYFGDGVDAEVATDDRRGDRAAAHARRDDGRHPAAGGEALGAGVLRDRAGGGVVEPVALRRRALRPSREDVRRPRRHVQEDARRGLRRRGQAPHPRRHLRALARLLRRLLSEGAEGAPVDRERLPARVRGRRRDRRPGRADGGLPHRRDLRRSGADVSRRHLHRRREPDRRAGDLDPRGVHAGRTADRPAPSGERLSAKRSCSPSRIDSSRRPIGTCGCRRFEVDDGRVGSRHRDRDARAAFDRVQDLLGRVDRVRRRAEHASLGRRHRAARRASGAEQGRRRARDPLRARSRRNDQPPQRLRPQELFLSRPSEGLPDLAVRDPDRRRAAKCRSCRRRAASFACG